MEHLGLAMHSHHEQEMRLFAFNLADLATLLVFVVLGANIPFGALGDNLLPALAVLATLLLVARPLTVLACALPDRGGGWTRQEIAFLCWTRETGVVPAALVGVLAGLGVPDIELYASVVALAIVGHAAAPGAAGAVAGRAAGAAGAAHARGAVADRDAPEERRSRRRSGFGEKWSICTDFSPTPPDRLRSAAVAQNSCR